MELTPDNGISFALHQVDGSERVSGGHVWPCLLDSLNGKHGLAHVVLTGRLGNPKSLSDDVLKIRVHADYESAAGGKRKAPPERGHPQPLRDLRKSFYLGDILNGESDAVRALLFLTIVLLALSACKRSWEPPAGTGHYDRSDHSPWHRDFPRQRD